MITSADNHQLKLIRKLRQKKHRAAAGLCVAEGEDLVEAALAAGLEPEALLVAGEDVEPELLAAVSELGSGTRVIGVFPQRWSEPGGSLSVYLHGVHDPGNVGTVIRSAHALCDGPVTLGPDCADPYGPKALRASMGSIFARPPARATFEALPGTKIALVAHGAEPLAQVAQPEPPPLTGSDPSSGLGAGLVLCVGGERAGLPAEVAAAADARATIPLRSDGPDSLNVAMATTVALYELGTRMAARG
jgi:TrmH family RNA methyltransferase